MRSHMSLQKPGSAKGFSTHVALMKKLVSQNMHRQRRHWDIRLATVLAAFGELAVQASVRLFVSREIRRCGIWLTTFSTNIPASTANGVLSASVASIRTTLVYVLQVIAVFVQSCFFRISSHCFRIFTAFLLALWQVLRSWWFSRLTRGPWKGKRVQKTNRCY